MLGPDVGNTTLTKARGGMPTMLMMSAATHGGSSEILAEERDQAGAVPVVRRVCNCAKDNSRVRADAGEEVQSFR